MAGYRLWCKNKNEWEKDNAWIGLNGCLMTLRDGCPYPLGSDTHILLRSIGKWDIRGREVFEGDVIENPDGLRMEIRYGLYDAYCPIDRCNMDSVGFYAVGKGLSEMPIGCLEDYANVIGNIYENPDLKII